MVKWLCRVVKWLNRVVKWLSSVIPSAHPLPVPKHASRCLHHHLNKHATPPSLKVELPFDIQVLV